MKETVKKYPEFQPAAEESVREQDQQQLLRILVVEDNPGDVVLIREMLKSSGIQFSLSKASTLKESTALLSSETFSAVLLDLGLPDSSGIDTLKNLLSSVRSLPVVVMTGLDDEDIALAALREGAQDYIVKNRIEPENILRSIKYSIERKKLENLQEKNSRQLSILSSTTASLHLGDEVSPIYSLICNSIEQLLENSIAIAIEFNSSTSLRIIHSESVTWKNEFYKSTGIDLDAPEINITGEQMDLINRVSDGNIYRVTGGLYTLLGRTIEREKCDKLETVAGIRYIHVIGFVRNRSYLGGAIILTKNLPEKGDLQIVENLCSQASLSIYRRIITGNLVASEARYQKLAEELEEKVLERTRELEVANEQLRLNEAQLLDLNATKDKFFSIVAHDLKNPFTSLLGATELLFENIGKMDKEKIRRLAQILNDSAKSGYAILLNLLDWSRSQTGMIKINLQNVSLQQLFENNISDLHLSCLDKEIEMISELKKDIILTSDRNMLNTVIRNLMSNAVKFTQHGGKITLNATDNGEEVTISVKDTGVGISEENLQKIFRIDSKFTRPGTDREVGTGLGLKLSREFVEKLGGRIWVTSEENKGSEFIFSVPVRKVHAK